MKSQEKSKIFIKHTSKVAEYIAEDTDFHLALDSEHEALHRVLEEECMELKDFLDLKYSRKPDLIGSYLESLQVPAIVTDKKNNFLGVMSEVVVRDKGLEKKVFYTSDLRVSKKAGIRTRMNFRKMYVNVLRQIEIECFTVVLKDNQKAINALTKNKNDLHYHSVYEYTSRSILVLPTLMLSSSKLKGVTIEEGRDQDYEANKRKESSFSHEISPSDEFFLMKKEGRVVGSFSIARPKNRNLRVEAKRRSVRFWITLANKLFSHNYEEKLPWIYMTSLFLEEAMDRAESVKMIMKFLYRIKKIRKGEIFLFCHNAQEELKLKIMAPEFNANGILYRVSADEANKSPLEGPIYLNPICL